MNDPIVCLRQSVWEQWCSGPNAWLVTKTLKQQQKFGEQFFASWCAARNLNVTRSPDSDANKIIEGQRVEIKFSTLWASGFYKFQQIRDQHYHYLICLGICPFDAHAWIFKKERIPFKHLSHQHGGSRGRDTWWMTVKPNNPPQWLHAQSGKLADVYRVLSRLRTR